MVRIHPGTPAHSRSENGQVGGIGGRSLSFRRHLSAEGKSPKTQRLYLDAINRLIEVIGDKDVRDVTRDDIREFLMVRGSLVSKTTLSIEYRALRVFFHWLVDEEEIKSSPTSRISAPQPKETPPPLYTDVEITRLLMACRGAQRHFDGIRDAAMVLLLLDAGMRRAELANIALDDVDLDNRIVLLRITKNGEPRIVPIGDRTALALDRYLRIRSRHKLAHLPNLFVGQHGPMTPDGISQTLSKIGAKANLPGVRAHRFRHTWAHRASVNGMQTQDLMTIAGWKSVQMVLRYGKSAAVERAIEAHRKYSPVDSLENTR